MCAIPLWLLRRSNQNGIACANIPSLRLLQNISARCSLIACRRLRESQSKLLILRTRAYCSCKPLKCVNKEDNESLRLILAFFWFAMLDSIEFSLEWRFQDESMSDIWVISYSSSFFFDVLNIRKQSRFRRGISQITGPCLLGNTGYIIFLGYRGSGHISKLKSQQDFNIHRTKITSNKKAQK